MGKFLKRRYFVNKSDYPMMCFAPVGEVMGNNFAKNPKLRETNFRSWFEVMWQLSDFVDAPEDVPTERDYWEKWV